MFYQNTSASYFKYIFLTVEDVDDIIISFFFTVV